MSQLSQQGRVDAQLKKTGGPKSPPRQPSGAPAAGRGYGGNAGAGVGGRGAQGPSRGYPFTQTAACVGIGFGELGFWAWAVVALVNFGPVVTVCLQLMGRELCNWCGEGTVLQVALSSTYFLLEPAACCWLAASKSSQASWAFQLPAHLVGLCQSTSYPAYGSTVENPARKKDVVKGGVQSSRQLGLRFTASSLYQLSQLKSVKPPLLNVGASYSSPFLGGVEDVSGE